MKKTLVALLMTTVMAAGCLVGCGEQKEVNKSSESQKATETSKATESSVEVKEAPVKVTWLFMNDPQEDQEMVEEAVNEILRERYNLELDMVFIPTGEYAQKVMLMSSGGEEFDICFTSGWANKFDDNMARGAFLALDKYLESDAGALLREAVPEEYWAAATVNGEIYAVPNEQLMYSQTAIVIQKSLADKYNLDVDSIDEMRDIEPFLEQIRVNEPTIWPYSTDGVHAFNDADQINIEQLCNGFVAVLKDDPEYKVQAVVDLSISEDFIHPEELYHEWWEKGYIRKDMITITSKDTQNVNANRYATYTGQNAPGVEATLLAKHGVEYYVVPVGNAFKAANAPRATMNAVSVTSPNPEAAVKMLGVMYTDVEVYNMLTFGLEGEHYTWVDDKHIALVADRGYKGFGGWEIGNQFNAYLLEGQDDDVWEVTRAGNESAPASPLDGFVVDTVPIEAELANLASADTEFKNMQYTDNYEEMREQKRAKLYEAGLQKVIDEVQKQIDEWRVANGK